MGGIGEGVNVYQAYAKYFSGFDLINLHELKTEKLLSSQVPEVIMLVY